MKLANKPALCRPAIIAGTVAAGYSRGIRVQFGLRLRVRVQF